MIDKILLGVGAVIALVVAIVIVWLMIANAHLRTEIAEARATMTACQLANDDFTRKTAIQNAAVQSLKKNAEARQKQAEAAVRAAQKAAAKFAADARRLSGASLSGDDCKAASDLLDHYMAEIR